MAMDDFEELMRIQRQMASRIVRESETNRKLNLMDVVNDLVTDKNKKVQTEKVIIEAGLQGIDEEDCLRMIDELIDLGMVTQPEPGFLKRA